MVKTRATTWVMSTPGFRGLPPRRNPPTHPTTVKISPRVQFEAARSSNRWRRLKTMTKYLFLYRTPESAEERQPSPEEMQAMFAQWDAWKKKFKANVVDV